MAGFLEQLEREPAKGLAPSSSRSGQLIAEVRQLLGSFPTHAPQDPALQSAMTEIQSKFKTLLATLGAASYAQPRGVPTLDF